MKLIDLLVKELPKRGGWPAFASVCWSDPDGEIRFDNDTARDFYPSPDFVNGDDLACIIGNSSNGITRDQYESALSASDAWIEWGGGRGMPVNRSDIVDLRFRELGCETGVCAGLYYWHHTLSSTDIIAYRPHKPDLNSRANDDQLEQDLNECIGQDVDMPEWSGDGLPPAGIDIEYRLTKVNYRNDFSRGRVIAYGISNVFMEHWSSKNEFIQPLDKIEFRPLRTEAEKAREKLAASLHIAAGASPIELNGIGPLYFELADAIISGSVFGTTFKADK